MVHIWMGGSSRTLCGSWAVHRCKGRPLLDIDASVVLCQRLAPLPVSEVGLVPSGMSCWVLLEFLVSFRVAQEVEEFWCPNLWC